MTLEQFGTRSPSAKATQFTTGFFVSHFLVGDSADEFADPETSRVASAFPGWKNVVCSDALWT